MGIMNYAQLIQDGMDEGSPLGEYASKIMVETDRIGTIVKNLLSFARQDKQESRSAARMSDIVNDTLSLVATVMRHDQITFTVDVPEDLPMIKCSSQQIHQVVMNLLTNARDALNEKYAEFDENKRIMITAHVLDKDGQHWIRTSVEDAGPGIFKEVRELMFAPFYTTKPKGKGTGLGLSISHGIVKDHHGEMSVESELGEWTRFHVDLPVGNGEGAGTSCERARPPNQALEPTHCGT